jgi:Tfp pilus assembly protein PilO
MQATNMHATELKFHRGSWLVTIPLVAIAVIHIVFVFFPGRNVINQLRAEIESRQHYISNADSISTALAAAQQELLEARSYIENWQRAALTVHRLPVLYGKINNISHKAGTATTRFEPQLLVELGLIKQIPIHMACTGTFIQIHEFIRSMENLPQTIWIDALQFNKTGQTGGNILCEIDLVVFSDNPKISNYADISK